MHTITEPTEIQGGPSPDLLRTKDGRVFPQVKGKFFLHDAKDKPYEVFILKAPEAEGGEHTKARVKWGDAKGWSKIEDAVQALKYWESVNGGERAHIAWAMNGEQWCLDLDGKNIESAAKALCDDDGDGEREANIAAAIVGIKADHEKIVEGAGEYTFIEVSRSGNGQHIIFEKPKGQELPELTTKNVHFAAELYRGDEARLIILTGNLHPSSSGKVGRLDQPMVNALIRNFTVEGLRDVKVKAEVPAYRYEKKSAPLDYSPEDNNKLAWFVHGKGKRPTTTVGDKEVQITDCSDLLFRFACALAQDAYGMPDAPERMWDCMAKSWFANKYTPEHSDQNKGRFINPAQIRGIKKREIPKALQRAHMDKEHHNPETIAGIKAMAESSKAKYEAAERATLTANVEAVSDMEDEAKVSITGLPPVPLPRDANGNLLPKVAELFNELSRVCSGPEHYQHVLHAATFMMLDTLTAPLANARGRVPMMGNLLIAESGGGKGQSMGPLSEFLTNRIPKGIPAAFGAHTAFRLHSSLKSAEDARDKSREAAVDLISLSDCDQFIKALCPNQKSTAKFEGAATHYIADYDGNNKTPAQGAKSRDQEVYKVLDRPVKLWAFDIQPSAFASSATKDAIEKGSMSRLNYIWLPSKVFHDDGSEGLVDSHMIKFPPFLSEWRDVFTHRHVKASTSPPEATDSLSNALVDFTPTQTQRQMVAKAFKALQEVHNQHIGITLNHTGQQVYRAARVYDMCHIQLPPKDATETTQFQFSDDAIRYGLELMKNSIKVLSAVDDQYGIGGLEGMETEMIAWRGIYRHAAELQRRAEMKDLEIATLAFTQSRAQFMGRKTLTGDEKKAVQTTIYRLFQELIGMGALTTGYRGKGVKIADASALLAFSKASCEQCGGSVDPYKTRGA